MFQMIMIISALTLELRSDGKMIATSRAKGDPAKIAQKNGWTFCQKKRLTLADRRDILIDVLGVRLANDPSFSIEAYTAEAIGEDGVIRAQEVAREIVELNA